MPNIDTPATPHAVCSDNRPHASHRIAGTWRSQCPGVEVEQATFDALGQRIIEQFAQLSDSERLLIKSMMDDLEAGRPVEYFAPGTKVYCDGWGTTVFIVQGVAPWHDDGVVSHKVEIRSVPDTLGGHVYPHMLRRATGA